MTTVTPQELLDMPLPPNDANADTVRGYLIALLTELWREEEGFDCKRPFGNSGWQHDIYQPMADAGLIKDTWGDRAKAEQMVIEAIKALGEPSPVAWQPAGYQGPAQHTATTNCDGFHEPGQCNAAPVEVQLI